MILKSKISFILRLAAVCVTTFALLGLAACDSGGAVVIDANVEPSTDGTVVQPLAGTEDPGLQESETSEPQLQPEPEPEPQPEVLGPASVEDITDLVLVTGQSNALGAGTAYDQYLDAPNDRVMAFTDDGWQVASLNQVWDLGWFPRTHPDTDPSNNFSLHFGKRVLQRRSDRVVGFILITAPGKKISHWDQGGQFFNDIRNKVSAAINEVPYKSELDAILWHQGESDGENRDEYSDALYDLIARFRSEPWYRYEAPFICGETAISPVNEQLRKLNRDQDPWTACVAGEGLATSRDDEHFSAESLRTLGSRYGDAYLEMMLGVR